MDGRCARLRWHPRCHVAPTSSTHHGHAEPQRLQHRLHEVVCQRARLQQQQGEEGRRTCTRQRGGAGKGCGRAATQHPLGRSRPVGRGSTAMHGVRGCIADFGRRQAQEQLCEAQLLPAASSLVCPHRRLLVDLLDQRRALELANVHRQQHRALLELQQHDLPVLVGGAHPAGKPRSNGQVEAWWHSETVGRQGGAVGERQQRLRGDIF